MKYDGQHKTFCGLALCLLLLVPLTLYAQGDSAVDREKEMSFAEKVSYVIGHQIVANLVKTGIDLDMEALVRGIREALTGQACTFTLEEQTNIMKEFAQKQATAQATAQNATQQDPRWKTQLTKPEMMSFDAQTDYYWILETNKGKITIKLWPEVAPMHVTSTIFLTEKGFYDNLTFHRVIPGFMAQGGCPLGTGTGGPGYQYAGEFDPKVKHDRPYLLSMANAGPGTDGSQFFLTFKATPWLNGKHTLFGEITEGQDVMKKLEAAGTDSGTPKEKLLIKKATIEKKPKD